MSLHKLTAGHGYTYLTRQVAAQDASAVPAGGLGAYYAERGEAPGRWIGAGLGGVDLAAGSAVTETQMVALFGEGRRPDAAVLAIELRASGADEEAIAAATELGTPFELNLANNEFLRLLAQEMKDWNRIHGEADCAPIPPSVKAWIRTAVAEALFAQQHGREPDHEELASFIGEQSRIGSRAVAGYDLTFSPVKSVSALWAVADEAAARRIEDAHGAAVADTVRWLEEQAVFTRLGRNGVRQVDAHGLIAASFVHRSSRAGDPDLHTHVAVSNKVQTSDGRWRALDGRVLHKAAVAASERYNTRLEAELRDRLGVRFVDRRRPGRRPVREIDGVDERLLTRWSQRRDQIASRQADLSARFQRKHGRPPTAVEAIELAQQATLETRSAKHEPTSQAEQRRQWRSEALDAIGLERLAGMLGRVDAGGREVAALDGEQLAILAGRVVDEVQQERATWQRWHVIAEAQRQLRPLQIPLAHLDAALERIVEIALGERSVTLTRPDAAPEPPPALRRSDGASVYEVAGSQMYTSPAVLAAEEVVIAAASRFDGQRAGQTAIALALLESTANGLALNDGQAAFVRELAGSGARCQLALAPAGTGKTTALRALTRAWFEHGGTVIPLAPSAAAARVLGEATDTPADTIAKALRELGPGGTLQLNDRDLIVVDEAGMASTPDLARLVEHAMAASASVRLVGDDRQLAAIGAGGLLRDLAEADSAVTLQEAVRFADPAEARAALQIRDGRAEALDFYADAARIHVGDQHTASDSAYQAWAKDRAAGRDALLIAGTRDGVTRLNVRARADRIAGQSDARQAREAKLADGSAASTGDPIITRRNDRRLGITTTDWVKNGDRWTVRDVHDNGAITAVHRDTGRHVVLPSSYAAEHVALGYATTIHSAQGSTADVCHAVITGAESRQQLYVALSRGRVANHLHVALPGAADDHAAVRRDTLIPPTARDVLRRVLDRDEAARSATSEMRALADPEDQLYDAVRRYEDCLAVAPVARSEPPAGPAPLPWMPPVPSCTDESWRRYLQARADQISDLAGVVRRAERHTPLEPGIAGEIAVWIAVHPVEDPAAMTPRERRYMSNLRALARSTSGPREPSRSHDATLDAGYAPTHSHLSI